MLTWAIQRADKDVEELSVKFNKLPQWIDKSWAPTLKQLEDFAKSVYLPFGYLFLSEPPEEELPIVFFKGNAETLQSPSIHLLHTIQIVKDRQEWLTTYLDEEGFEPLPFVGKYNEQSSSKEIVEDILKTLLLEEDWFRQLDSQNDMLPFLIERIEKVGIITSFSGTVDGNTHRVIDREEFRGFALVHSLAPFIFINSNDVKAAQLFTLIHELAHIWLGVSSGTDMKKLLPADHPIERLCDQVAAEFFVPKSMFMEQWSKTKDVQKISAYFKVAPLIINRRALDFSKISRSAYFTAYDHSINTWLNNKQNKDSGGGNYYYTTRRRISAQFGRYINSAVKQDRLLYRDAYNLLNVRGNTYERLVKEYL